MVIFVIYKVTFRSGEEHNLSWQIKESLGKCWKCNKRCCCRPSPFLALLADADGCRFLRIFSPTLFAAVPFILERRGHFFRILVYLDNNKRWTNSFFSTDSFSMIESRSRDDLAENELLENNQFHDAQSFPEVFTSYKKVRKEPVTERSCFDWVMARHGTTLRHAVQSHAAS